MYYLSGREAVAAVVGLQMRYDKFYELFMKTTNVCPNRHQPCNLTCESDVSILHEVNFLSYLNLYPKLILYSSLVF